MNRLLSILLASTLLPTSAIADKFVVGPLVPPEGSTEVEEMLVAARDFVLTMTTYQYDGEPLPTVELMTPEQMLLVAYDPNTLLEYEQKGQEPPQPKAFYVRSTNTMVISDEHPDMNTLVHEMVHYFQHVSGKTDEFVQWPHCLEAEAYDVQYTWHHVTKLEMEDVPDYGFVLTLYAVCNDADFSWTTD